MAVVWSWQQGRKIGDVEVVDVGEEVENEENGAEGMPSVRFRGAKIAIHGAAFHGDVLVGAPDGVLEPPILQVVESQDTPRELSNQGFVPRAVLEIPSEVRKLYRELTIGHGAQTCGGHIASLEAHERLNFFSRLQFDRIRRKAAEVMQVFEACERSWNETMYVMLSQGLGTINNKGAFGVLARRVSFANIARERHDPEQVEAMLLGTAGLLDIYEEDKYIRRLRGHFEHLRAKYRLHAIDAGVWRVRGESPNGNPVLRIAQMANLLAGQDFLFDRMVACRTAADVQRLFASEASEYWSARFGGGGEPKRLGVFMANTLGINIVATMIFAYGSYLGDEEMREAAIELLEKIKCEENSIVTPWRAAGVPMESAFDSQAVIQLHNEWCLKRRCVQCREGRKRLKRIFNF